MRYLIYFMIFLAISALVLLGPWRHVIPENSDGTYVLAVQK